MSYHKKLATQINNLLNTLCLRFPNDKNLALCLTGIETLKNHNLRKISEFYISKIYLRKTKNNKTFPQLISARDSTFFLENIFAEELDISQLDLDPIITTLRKHWYDLTEDEQSNIWMYFDVLNRLTEKHLKETLKRNNY